MLHIEFKSKKSFLKVSKLKMNGDLQHLLHPSNAFWLWGKLSPHVFSAPWYPVSLWEFSNGDADSDNSLCANNDLRLEEKRENNRICRVEGNLRSPPFVCATSPNARRPLQLWSLPSDLHHDSNIDPSRHFCHLYDCSHNSSCRESRWYVIFPKQVARLSPVSKARFPNWLKGLGICIYLVLALFLPQKKKNQADWFLKR